MIVFCEYPQIFGDVDFLYRNKRLLCADTLEHVLCLVAEWTIGFRIELELNWLSFQLF